MSNDPVLWLLPLLLYLREELLELLDRHSCLAQLALRLHQLSCRLPSVRPTTLRPRRQRRNLLLQEVNRDAQDFDMILDGSEEVGES